MKDTRRLDFDTNGVAIPDEAFWFAWKNRDRQTLYQVYGPVRPCKLEPEQVKATGYPQWVVFGDTELYKAFFKDLDNLPRKPKDPNQFELFDNEPPTATERRTR